jgi:hypothetical protein
MDHSTRNQILQLFQKNLASDWVEIRYILLWKFSDLLQHDFEAYIEQVLYV